MKIISLNTWGGCIHAPLLNYLQESDADIYCLQEIYSTPEPRSGPQLLIDAIGIEARPDLYTDIQEVLGEGYNSFFWPAVSGYLQGGGKSEFPFFYGIATFVRKSIPVLASRTEFVFGGFRYYDFARSEAPTPRNAHAFRVWDEESQKTILVSHFHGIHQENQKVDSFERQVQGKALVALVEGMRATNEASIVCGDFNLRPGSETHGLFERRGYEELVAKYEFTDTRTSFYDKSFRYADYMFVSPQVGIESFEVVAEPEVSDHRALMIECS